MLQFRQRIPRDVLDRARGRTITIPIGSLWVQKEISPTAVELTISLGTREPGEAKARQTRLLSHLEGVWKGMREGPVRLTQKQVIALSGTVYRAFSEALEDDPGSPIMWEWVQANNVAASKGRYGVKARLMIGSDDERKRAGMEDRFGRFVDATLAREGLNVDEDSRRRLLIQTARALHEAAQKLQRNAEGDYRPDKAAERFPEWEKPGRGREQQAAARSGGKATLSKLLEDWWKEARATGLSPSTYQSYSSAIDKLTRFLGHEDASRINPTDVVAFKDHRLAQINPRTGLPVSPKTVKDSDLAGLKAILTWAVANHRLAANPAAGVTVKIGKKTKLRENGFTDEEAIALLSHAHRYTSQGNELRQTRAAKRWVPWLCAYTGAREGEIAQLRKEDVQSRDGHWIIRITPEAGTVKTKEAREVPLHLHLVELGFPSFVDGAPDGHLFIKRSKDGDVLGPLQGVKNRLAEFARQVVADKRVAPNHGWRHRFKTVGLEAGISERVLDVIGGWSAPRSVGGSYGNVTMKAMVNAMAEFPRYRVE